MYEYCNKQAIQNDFLDEFSAVANQQYDLQSTPGGKTISVQIDKLEFNSLGDGLVVFKINASASFYYTNKTGRKITLKTIKFRFKGKPESVDLWIEAHDDFYQSTLVGAYRALSTQIIRTL